VGSFIGGSHVSGTQTPVLGENNDGSSTPPVYRDARWKTKTCPFWIIGKCNHAAENCKYSHVYDLEKLPECQYKLEQDCPKGTDCIYKHIKDLRADCPYYLRGFC
jgi:cleavage and polyadenylation specificity factor subunit 4